MSRFRLWDLNPEQQRAATHESGPLLILAGAGTGNLPCAHLIQPVPSTTGEANTGGLPSISKAIAAPTMSTMESTAPTSWK